MKKPGKLAFSHRQVEGLTDHEISGMWQLYNRYYTGSTEEIFRRDLAQKQVVILLHEKKSRQLKGFSTQVLNELMVGKRRCRILFSGDTVIEQAYWGQGALQFAFTLLLIKLKLQRPTQPLYWFLITKGFKTYLLLAKNFKHFWPRVGAETPPAIQQVMDEYARLFFGEVYIKEKGLLIFPEGTHDHLKEGVASIREQDLADPHIRYFLERNPDWQRGDELVCLGEYDLALPARVFGKTLLKQLRR